MSIDWGQMQTAEELAKVPVPDEIHRWQGVLQLKRAGYWDAVEAIFAAMPAGPEKDDAEAALSHTEKWRRTSPTLAMMAVALGLSEAQADELFIAATQIEV